MDENNPIVQILQQINDLSGAALDGLLKGGGGKGGPKPPGGGPAPDAEDKAEGPESGPPDAEDRREAPEPPR